MTVAVLLSNLFRAGLWLASRFSRSSAWSMSCFIARVLSLFRAQAAQVTRTNLETCYPTLSQKALNDLTRESLAHMCLLFFEFAALLHWPLEALLADVEVVGEDVLRHAYADERGILLLVPHFGNWELMCAFLGTHYSVSALYDPPKIESLEATILQARQRYEGEMFPIDTGGMRSVYRALRQGELVALLPDQVPDRSAGVYVDFFKQPALTMTLPHRLVDKTKPTVLIGSVQRRFHDSDQGYGYQIIFEALGAGGGTGEQAGTHAGAGYGNDDVEPFMQRVNAAIEAVVDRAPAQYQWEYKRFKRPPNPQGKANLYRRQ